MLNAHRRALSARHGSFCSTWLLKANVDFHTDTSRRTQRLENLIVTMVKTSVLNDALNAIYNAEKTGKRQVLIRPSSKVIVKFLQVMQKHGTLYENILSHIVQECG
jgi:hypothetical protein